MNYSNLIKYFTERSVFHHGWVKSKKDMKVTENQVYMCLGDLFTTALLSHRISKNTTAIYGK